MPRKRKKQLNGLLFVVLLLILLVFLTTSIETNQLEEDEREAMAVNDEDDGRDSKIVFKCARRVGDHLEALRQALIPLHDLYEADEAALRALLVFEQDENAKLLRFIKNFSGHSDKNLARFLGDVYEASRLDLYDKVLQNKGMSCQVLKKYLNELDVLLHTELPEPQDIDTIYFERFLDFFGPSLASFWHISTLWLVPLVFLPLIVRTLLFQ